MQNHYEKLSEILKENNNARLDRLGNLRDRWHDEWQYEQWANYKRAVVVVFDGTGFKVVKARQPRKPGARLEVWVKAIDGDETDLFKIVAGKKEVHWTRRKKEPR